MTAVTRIASVSAPAATVVEMRSSAAIGSRIGAKA
ncbi:hypothetical protein JOD67_005603 [Tenggerimyces flavus]|nr:hypothetical protein [Tenggerimyces flavus]